MRCLVLFFALAVFADDALWNEVMGTYADGNGNKVAFEYGQMNYVGYDPCPVSVVDTDSMSIDDPNCGSSISILRNDDGSIYGVSIDGYEFSRDDSSKRGEDDPWGNWEEQYQDSGYYDDYSSEDSNRAGGTRRALLVGINYKDTSAELGGCINDVMNHKKILMSKFGFAESDIVVLTEDQDEAHHPTKAKIEEGIEWLIKGLKPGDKAVFHYSGHGSQVPDNSGSESDGKTEVLVPLDFDHGSWETSFITDDYLNQKLVRSIPKGAKVLALFDCCHSGTASDVSVLRALPEEDDLEIKPRFLPPPEWMIQMFQMAMEAYFSNYGHHHNQVPLPDEVPPPSPSPSPSGGGSDPDVDYWSFSGCRDDQTSADASLEGIRQGAFTWGYLKALKQHNYDVSYETLHQTIKSTLANKFEQQPILATTRESRLKHKILQ